MTLGRGQRTPLPLRMPVASALPSAPEEVQGMQFGPTCLEQVYRPEATKNPRKPPF